MLVEVIKKIAEETQEARQPYRHRPSSACKCIRQSVYHAMKVEPKMLPGRALLVFDDSKWHEELTSDWIRKSGYKLHSEQMKVDVFKVNNIMVGGSIDGMITDPMGNDYLLEIKSINHFAFQRIEKNPSEAHEYYVQCVLYLYGLKKEVGADLDAVLLIKNKNTAQYQECLIVPDRGSATSFVNVYTIEGSNRGQLIYTIDDPVQTAWKRFNLIDECLSKNIIPERPYRRDDWHSGYCPYQEVCWAGYEEEVAAMPRGIDLEPYFSKELITTYLNCKEEYDDLNKDLKEAKDALKNIMMNLKIQSGYIGDVEITRNFREIKGYQVLPRTDEIISIKKNEY